MDGEFIRYLEEAIGPEKAAVASSAFGRPASVSVRFNPFKPLSPAGVPSGPEPGPCGGASGAAPCVPSASAAGRLFGCNCADVPWSRGGCLLDRRPDFTLDPLFHCGAYYVQDSSAMFVGEVFRRALGEHRPGADGLRDASCEGEGGTARCFRVLDLCAAPGGKTTDLAASLREKFGDGFLLVANEVMGDRAGVLAENVAKWGDPCVMVTGADPAAFSALPGFFDIVLADVPCSGEGMFRKDEGARAQWSPENVGLCAARQRRIVADVWPALAPGGVFIYSTCTFNKYENDGNVEWMLENLDCGPLETGLEGFTSLGGSLESGIGESVPFGGPSGECRAARAPEWSVLRTDHGFSLVPGLVPGEGQYCAAVRKAATGDGGSSPRNHLGKAPARKNRVEGALPEAARRCAGWLDMPAHWDCGRAGGTLPVAVPLTIAAEVGAVRGAVRTLRAGCAVGTVKGRDIVPSADLALCIRTARNAFPEAAVDRDTALKFLHRDGILLPDAPKGHLMLTYMGLPLGFVKNLGTRCNNLHPPGRRIRMDLK